MLTLIAFALVSIVIARRLGAEQLGAYSLAMTLGSLVQIAADAGYSIWLPREVAQQPSHVHLLVAGAIATKGTLWLITSLAVLSIAAAVSTEAVVLTAFVLVDVAASCVSFSILAALRGIEWYVAPQLLSSLYSALAATGMVLCIIVGLPLWLAVVALAITGIARAVHLLKLLHRKTQQSIQLEQICARIHPSALVEQLREQWRLWVVNIFSGILHRGPLVILGMRSQPSELGYFSAAFRIYSAARILPGALFNAVLPRMVARQRDTRFAVQLLVLGAISSLLIATMLWFGAAPLIHATFTFEQAIHPLKLMAIAFAGLSMKTIVEAVLIGRRHDRAVAISVAVVAIATVVAAWCVSPDASSFSVILIGSEWCLFAFLFAWLFRTRSASSLR